MQAVKLREDGHMGCGVGWCLARCLMLWWRLQAHRELQLQKLAGGGGYVPGRLGCPSEKCCVLGSAPGTSGTTW